MSTSERPGLIQLPPAAARGEVGALGQRPALAADERAHLERRAKLLAWAGNGWHLLEFAIAFGAGIAAGSAALVGFGLDSLIEVAAAGVVIWLFSGGRGASRAAERRAQQLIAASYVLLVAYIGVVAVRDLVEAHHPVVSWVGIGLAAFTAPTMQPACAREAPGREDVGLVGDRLRSGPEHDLRLPVCRATRRSAAECPRGLVVRPSRRARDRHHRRERGRQSWRGESCDCC